MGHLTSASGHSQSSQHAPKLQALLLEGKLSLLLSSEDSGVWWQPEQVGSGGGSGVLGAWKWQVDNGGGSDVSEETVAWQWQEWVRSGGQRPAALLLSMLMGKGLLREGKPEVLLLRMHMSDLCRKLRLKASK